MINDVPDATDFRSDALSFLNIAWDFAVESLIVELERAKEYEEHIEHLEDNYEEKWWNAAKRQLRVAYTLAHQGVEFYLRSKIAEVSPFLLIDRGPNDWPKGATKTDKPYSEFHTVDAGQLLKIFDSVVPKTDSSNLSDDFRRRFEVARVNRNTIIHTVDKKIEPNVTEIVLMILEAVYVFEKGKYWIPFRREYLGSRYDHRIEGGEWVDLQLSTEFMPLVELLGATKGEKYFKLSKKNRTYICPQCSRHSGDTGEHVYSAQLKPNKPKSKLAFCFLCESEFSVNRIKCKEFDCKGNVILNEGEEYEYGPMCLTCTCEMEED